jgi:hypothetical protein
LCDEECTLLIETFSWADSQLLLNLKLLRDGSRWLVTCRGVEHWRLESRVIEGLEVSEDDPVLWRSQFAIYTEYFNGTPPDPYRAACDLLSAGS